MEKNKKNKKEKREKKREKGICVISTFYLP
jgi:hypothetical protein